MSKFKDLTGQRFGKLIAVKRYPQNTKTGGAIWVCKCDCGNETVVPRCSLTSGNTSSCGCGIHDRKPMLKHGLYRTSIYKIWRGMKSRCYTESNSDYKDYGGRGISICDEWLNDFVSFYNWSMNNSYSDGLSIDRIDVNGNYEPSNCRWATNKEQANNKRTNMFCTINGETKTLKEWSEERGIIYNTVRHRLALGYTVEEALDPDFSRKIPFKSDFNKEIHEKCKLHNIPYERVIRRIKDGWDIERALTEPIRPKKGKH